METEVMVGSGMNISCSRDELVQKLGVVARAVSTRTAVQILAGVLLRAEGGQLHLAATDMELSLRSSMDAQVEGEGSVVVPGRLLVDLARLLPESDVTIEHRVEEGIVRIACGAYESRLNTYNAEDFPRLPELDALTTFSVDREALLDTIARVQRSASRDESRPVLTGILARFEPGKLVMAATDAYRLSVKETQLAGAVPELEAIVLDELNLKSLTYGDPDSREVVLDTRLTPELRREGLARLDRLDPRPPVVRYERERPGEGVDAGRRAELDVAGVV